MVYICPLLCWFINWFSPEGKHERLRRQENNQISPHIHPYLCKYAHILKHIHPQTHYHPSDFAANSLVAHWKTKHTDKKRLMACWQLLWDLPKTLKKLLTVYKISIIMLEIKYASDTYVLKCKFYINIILCGMIGLVLLQFAIAPNIFCPYRYIWTGSWFITVMTLACNDFGK